MKTKPLDNPLAAIGPDATRPQQLAVMQQVVGLKVREIAYAASVTEQSIRNWRKKDSHDRPEAYDDLRAVVERIMRSEAFDPKLIGSWLRSRNSGLGYARPLEAIRAGRFAEVMDVAEDFVALSPPSTSGSVRAASPSPPVVSADEFAQQTSRPDA